MEKRRSSSPGQGDSVDRLRESICETYKMLEALEGIDDDKSCQSWSPRGQHERDTLTLAQRSEQYAKRKNAERLSCKDTAVDHGEPLVNPSPVINRMSRELAEKRNAGKNLYDRMKTFQEQVKSKQENLRETLAKREEAALRPSPAINPNSRKLANNRKIEDMMDWESMRTMRIAHKREEKDRKELEGLAFSPHLNEHSLKLASRQRKEKHINQKFGAQKENTGEDNSVGVKGSSVGVKGSSVGLKDSALKATDDDCLLLDLGGDRLVSESMFFSGVGNSVIRRG